MQYTYRFHRKDVRLNQKQYRTSIVHQETAGASPKAAHQGPGMVVLHLWVSDAF